MTLPCRRCTDLNGGEEVWKSVSAFSVSHKQSALWKDVLQKGQDLCCWKCMHQLKWKLTDKVVLCDHCNKIRSRKEFAPDMLKLWMTASSKAIVRSSWYMQHAKPESSNRPHE